MTNQEWLATLEPDQWWQIVWLWLIKDYGTRYTDMRSAVIEWLKQEHDPVGMFV